MTVSVDGLDIRQAIGVLPMVKLSISPNAHGVAVGFVKPKTLHLQPNNRPIKRLLTIAKSKKIFRECCATSERLAQFRFCVEHGQSYKTPPPPKKRRADQ
ncbi:MAG TPA: hypothetical protein VHD56_09375, partial [Tepidisphaeraceae bacterium]|nr:hypothetical protein [Tepidisphaeraceae bacterium]